MTETRIETVKKLDLKSGDILLVTLGGEVEESVWIPTLEDLELTADTFRSAVPNDVEVIVFHHLVDVQQVTGIENIDTALVTEYANGDPRLN